MLIRSLKILNFITNSHYKYIVNSIGETVLKMGIHNFYEIFNSGNAILSTSSYGFGENLEYPLFFLKNELEKLGRTVDTLVMHPENDIANG